MQSKLLRNIATTITVGAALIGAIYTILAYHKPSIREDSDARQPIRNETNGDNSPIITGGSNISIGK